MNEKKVKRAWIFDVDGVIISPSEKRVVDDQLFDEIVLRIKVGEPVSLNTGRDLGFVNEKVIKPLQEKIDKSLMKNLFAVAEKGALWATFDSNGIEKENIDEKVSISLEIQNAVRSLVEKEFSDCMFYDETKRTMISVEMLHDGHLEKFSQKQIELIKKLENILTGAGTRNDYKIDATVIATDIQMNSVGKDLGARRVLEWLNKKGIEVEKFVCFGDSHSDLAMAEEIYSHGKLVEFVYVGNREIDVEDGVPFPITMMDEKYEAGTLKYLKIHR